MAFKINQYDQHIYHCLTLEISLNSNNLSFAEKLKFF